MLIYIIRHGETDLNAAGVLQGWYDQPLNDSGRFLAAETGKKLKGVRFDGCFSSPLKRAAETAEILLRESGNEIPVIYDDRLKEMSFGVKEGSRLSPEEAAVFRADPRRLERFAGGEAVPLHIDFGVYGFKFFFHTLAPFFLRRAQNVQYTILRKCK